MKWILKKDLPWASAGQIVSADSTSIGRFHAFSIYDEDNKKLGAVTMTDNQFYDWFEKVDERWKPEEYEVYYFVGTECDIGYLKWEKYVADEDRYKVGNCFKTKEAAQRAAEEIKALLKEFHKNNP